MATEAVLGEINSRYSKLAEESCCLSCGGAINYSEAQPGEVCLDLGCGRGNDVLKLALAVGEYGFAYGIDISEGMIRKSRKNAEKLGVENVEFIQTKLDNLKVDESTVDLVISNCTINHASDKSAVWSEIYRVLKKGGRFVVSDIFSSEEVPEEYRNDPVAVSECWAGAVTRDEYLKTLVQCGFQDIQIFEESAPYPKGQIEVSSFTIAGKKPGGCCCCGGEK